MIEEAHDAWHVGLELRVDVNCSKLEQHISDPTLQDWGNVHPSVLRWMRAWHSHNNKNEQDRRETVQ